MASIWATRPLGLARSKFGNWGENEFWLDSWLDSLWDLYQSPESYGMISVLFWVLLILLINCFYHLLHLNVMCFEQNKFDLIWTTSYEVVWICLKQRLLFKIIVCKIACWKNKAKYALVDGSMWMTTTLVVVESDLMCGDDNEDMSDVLLLLPPVYITRYPYFVQCYNHLKTYGRYNTIKTTAHSSKFFCKRVIETKTFLSIFVKTLE